MSNYLCGLALERRFFLLVGALCTFAFVWYPGVLRARLQANEEYVIVRKENLKGLANSKGKILIPVEYEDLGWSDGRDYLLENVIGYRNKGLWGLLNLKNERIADPVFSSLIPFNDHLLVGAKKLPYSKEIVYGIINTKGRTTLDFRYYYLERSGDYLVAVIEEDNQFKYGLIDEKGNVVISLNYRRIIPISPDLYGVMNKDKKVAIFDDGGNVLKEFVLDSIKPLSELYTLLYAMGKAGVMNTQTKQFISPRYREVTTNSDGVLVGIPFNTWYLLDSKNNPVDTLWYEYVDPIAPGIYKVRVGNAEALIDTSDYNLTGYKNLNIGAVCGSSAIFEQDGKYGILSLSGEILCSARFDTVRCYNDFFLAEERLHGGKGWSLYDHHGQRISRDLYDEIQPLSGRFFQVRKNDYWGALNGVGKEVLLCKYDSIVKYLNGKFEVNFLGESGILDLNEKWVIMPQKKEVEIVDPIRYLVRSPYGSYVAFYPKTIELQTEYFLYKRGDIYLERTLDNKFGLRDHRGEKIVRPVFDEISELYEDSIYIMRHENRHSFISKHGKVMNFGDDRFDVVKPMSDYMIGVLIGSQWGFVDVYGKLRIANRYEDIGKFDEGMGAVKLIGKWGFVNKREVLKVQPRYEQVFPFRNGLSVVIKDGKYGIIDREGQEVIETEYDKIIPLVKGGYITVKDKRKGLVNSAGRALFRPRFDEIRDLRNGYVIVERNERFGLMSDDGLSPIPMIYNQLIYDPYRDLYLASTSSESVPIEF